MNNNLGIEFYLNEARPLINNRARLIKNTNIGKFATVGYEALSITLATFVITSLAGAAFTGQLDVAPTISASIASFGFKVLADNVRDIINKNIDNLNNSDKEYSLTSLRKEIKKQGFKDENEFLQYMGEHMTESQKKALLPVDISEDFSNKLNSIRNKIIPKSDDKKILKIQ